MTVSLLAEQCPAIQTPTALITKSSAYALSATAPVAQSLSTGDTTTVGPKLNSNAMQLDLLGRYGGGGYAVAYGLTLSAPASGLNLNIAAGHAVIDGVVEVPAATTLAVPGSAARVYVWLQQNGTLTYTTSLTAPAGACCFLGSCVTGAGNITDVDTSGVLYLRGGVLWRETADEGEPTDEPPATVMLFTRTLGGLYQWDGTEYGIVGTAASTIAEALVAVVDAHDDLERRFRALLGRLVELVGDEVITEELVDDAQIALSEA